MTPSARPRHAPQPRPLSAALPLPHEHFAAIDRSHARCAESGLSRIGAPAFDPLGAAELTRSRERNQRLFVHAVPVMEMLREQVSDTESMVLLTDSSGTVLHSVGNDGFLARASKVALQPGVNWSEPCKGTNAIGTALVNERPTLVHADEHFMHANHFLTCSAVPIFDPRGDLLGVLDVSGDHRSYHQHTMGLLKMSVCMIENHWLSEDCRASMRLQFHARAECLDTLMEGILSVAPDGHVTGANRSALDQLGLSSVALRRQTLESLWGVGVGTIVDHFRASMAAPMTLRDKAGRAVQVLARVGWPVVNAVPRSAPAAVVAGPTLAQTQAQLIEQTVRDAGGNISAASKALGISRNRVYRALRGVPNR